MSNMIGRRHKITCIISIFLILSVTIPIGFVQNVTSLRTKSFENEYENGLKFENITNEISSITRINASTLPPSVPFAGGPPEPPLDNSSFASVNASPPVNTINLSSIAFSTVIPNIRFDGISEATGNCKGCPPDVTIAVGPNGYVMEMVNFAVSIGKHPNCNPLCSTGLSFHLASFFGLPPNSPRNISDPKVMYDGLSGRWFASILDATNNSVLLATSTTSNPTQGWFILELPFSNCPDRPNLGVNDDILAISATVVTDNCQEHGSLQGMEFLLIHKFDLISGAGPPRTLTVQTDPNMPYDLHPIQAYDNNSPLFMAGIDLPTGREALLRVMSFTRDITDPNFSQGVNIAFVPINYPIKSAPANQPGTNVQLETGEFRIQDAAWRDGVMWVTFNDSCTAEIDSSCIRLIQLRTAQPSSDTVTVGIEQDFDRGPNYFYPSLEIDKLGNMMFVFGTSSSDIFPSLMVSGQSVGDPLGSARAPFLLKSGGASYTTSESGGTCQNVCRYGDYFGSAVDPTDPMRIWLAGQYVKPDSSYSTFIAQMQSPIG
jgi:hypothetical protein